MTYEDAIERARKILDKEFGHEEYDVIINEAYSFEFPRGWIFRYNTPEFIYYQDTDNCLFVTSPIVIDKIDNTVYRVVDKQRTFKLAEDLVKTYLNYKEKGIDLDVFNSFFSLDTTLVSGEG